MREIALTIDDGPTEHTGALLDALAQNGVLATFYLVGSNVGAHAEVVRRILAEGHQVGSHSHTHTSEHSSDSAAYEEDFVLGEQSLRNAGVSGAISHRLPYGRQADDARLAVLEKHGRDSVGWHVDSLDYHYARTCTPDATAIFATSDALNQVGKAHGSAAPLVVLLHDRASGALLVRMLVAALFSAGYRFKRVDELTREQLPLSEAHGYAAGS